MKNKLIVIEGGDGAGKGTQAKLLVEAFRSQGIKVFEQDFPRYNTSLFGALCGRALKGDFGDFRNLSPYLASLPYTLDRVSAREDIKKSLRKGVVICNRYTPSNVAFQAAKLAGKQKRDFITFLENAEYGELGLTKPDLVVYLRVPAKTSHALVAEKSARGYMSGVKGARDQHESDIQFQKNVAKTYLTLAKKRPDWQVIECTKKGKMLTREEIHKKILATVQKFLS